MPKFIPIVEFAAKYEIIANNVYVGRNQGQFPDYVFSEGYKGAMLIDEEFFIKRHEFRKKIWLKAHDNFYFLTKNMSSYQLSYYLSLIDPSQAKSCWSTFLNGNLFTIPPTAITFYKTSDLLYKFYRYSRWIIQMAFKKVGVRQEHRDINKLLDAY